MGSMLDCFRGSTNEQDPKNVTTPDAETRRSAAAEAASRRFQKAETRGVDEDEYRRLKQREAERQRLEQEQSKLLQGNNREGLRWQMN